MFLYDWRGKDIGCITVWLLLFPSPAVAACRFYPWLSATRGRALLRSLQGQLNFQPTLREEGLNLCEDVVHLYAMAAMVMQAHRFQAETEEMMKKWWPLSL